MKHYNLYATCPSPKLSTGVVHPVAGMTCQKVMLFAHRNTNILLLIVLETIPFPAVLVTESIMIVSANPSSNHNSSNCSRRKQTQRNFLQR